MKRIFAGTVLLSSIVGVGSAGVFYARGYFAPAAPAANETEVADEGVPREAVPIPLSGSAATGGNPFARQQQTPPAPVDRYAEPQPTLATAEPAEIPDADQTMAAPPAEAPRTLPRARIADTRYAEQPAAAEVPAEEPLEPADSPELAPAPLAAPIENEPAEEEPVDRYGRPASRQAIRGQAAEPEEPAEAEPPRDFRDSVPDTQPAEEPEASTEGTGKPGEAHLSGSQAPTLTIEKTAPAEIQIGKAAKFVIKVRNAGAVVAHGVEIHDTIPQGTQLIETTPDATRGAGGALVWDLGTIKPGEEQKVELQLMPTAEGEIGSVATVHFRAEASVRTVATRPMLNIEVVGPAKVMKGQEVTLKIKLSNPGTGAATGVVLSEAVPEGLKHPAGGELELEIGTIKAGETRELELGLMAAAPGTVTNVINAQGDGSLQAEARAEVEIVAPQLQVSLTGPKRRYLERNATHQITVSNPGTAAAKDIELVAVLPKELKFVEANNGGQFVAATHSVHWGLEELPPQESGTVTLTTMPVQPGDAKLVLKTTGKQGLADQREEIVVVEGLAAINFQLSDVNDPIESGGQTAYEVRVTNQGSKAAANVRVVALVPKELKALSAEGPVRHKIEAGRVVFEPIKQLAPKADTTFIIKVQALSHGDARMQVQITTDELRDPITKEESTRIYGDE